jgi:uncharacterized protein YgfB (UPF0149 family)
MSSKPSSWPLILIAVAMTGAGISYHFTIDARFTALEQKLDQNSVALQQYQISEESVIAAKAEALDNLNKEVDALQASLTPLGKANKDQTDSLAQIRQQIASLGQLQQAQQDAEKKLADYASQLERIKHDVQMRDVQASSSTSTSLIGPVPPTVPLAPSAPASAPAPATTPAASGEVPTTHASTTGVKPTVAPLTETSTVDLRPAEITAPRFTSVRALPVALPVDNSLSDNR